MTNRLAFGTFLFCATFLGIEPAGHGQQTNPDMQARFARLVSEYGSSYSFYKPTSATDLGLHDHDGDLEDFSEAGLAKERSYLSTWKGRLTQIDKNKLSKEDAIDHALLAHAIDGRLFELNELRDFERRPSIYLRLATRSVYNLIKRDFAPLSDRLRSTVSRQEKIPALLAAGQKHLTRMSKESLETALLELPGIQRFFDKDVPAAFLMVRDPLLQKRFVASTEAVKKALAGFGEFLNQQKATAKTPFALGPTFFKQKLYHTEMISEPLPVLLNRGEAELARLRKEFAAVAKKIDPSLSPEEAQLQILKDHPEAAKVIEETQGRLASQRRFLIDHGIVSVPSEVMPTVKETPPFMRATSLASMETPGPFEPKATEAYYNVTLPDPAWPKDQAEDFLRGAYARPLIDVVSIHEAFPGHYVQYLYLGKVSTVRRFHGVASNSEGWAHYTEQMMLDEGYGGAEAPLRLMQLQDALLRAARYVAAIKLHTQGMTTAQAVDLFIKAHQTRKVAEMEARRGTEDPTYLCYTWGKLEILRLRDAYKRKAGASYSLQKFHDAFLEQGRLPLSLMRSALGLSQGR